MDEMIQATVRLAKEPSTRTALSKNGLSTASEFDIRRASLSELAVFRTAAAKMTGRRPPRSGFRRGPTPSDTTRDAKRITVLLPMADSQAAAHTVTERVLSPLRSKCVRDKVEMCEIRSIDELSRERADVLVVYRGTVTTSDDAATVVDRCRELNVPLVYGMDAAPSTDRRPAMRVQSRLIDAAARIVVSSSTIADDPKLSGRDTVITEAACDEELWFDAQFHYTHRSRDDVDGIRLLVYGDSSVDGLLGRVWDRVRFAAAREVSLDLVATSGPVPNGANLIPREPLHYTDFVRSVLVRGPWDIALLPSDARTAAADQRFLSLAAMGLAIVCSNEGAHLHYARSRQNAVVVESNEAAWTHAILDLIGARTARRQLGNRAREDVAVRYGVNRRAHRFLDAYGLEPSENGTVGAGT